MSISILSTDTPDLETLERALDRWDGLTQRERMKLWPALASLLVGSLKAHADHGVSEESVVRSQASQLYNLLEAEAARVEEPPIRIVREGAWG